MGLQKLTNEQLQDMSSFVYNFVVNNLLTSIQKQGELSENMKEILSVAASASSVAVAAACMYVQNMEDGKSPF